MSTFSITLFYFRTYLSGCGLLLASIAEDFCIMSSLVGPVPILGTVGRRPIWVVLKLWFTSTWLPSFSLDEAWLWPSAFLAWGWMLSSCSLGGRLGLAQVGCSMSSTNHLVWPNPSCSLLRRSFLTDLLLLLESVAGLSSLLRLLPLLWLLPLLTDPDFLGSRLSFRMPVKRLMLQ